MQGYVYTTDVGGDGCSWWMSLETYLILMSRAFIIDNISIYTFKNVFFWFEISAFYRYIVYRSSEALTCYSNNKGESI